MIAKYIDDASHPPPKYDPNCLEGLGVMIMNKMGHAIRLMTTEDNPIHARVMGVALAILLLIPTLLGACMYEVGKLLPHKEFTKKASEVFPVTDERIVDETLECLKVFHEVAEEQGVKYIVESGTLLGLARHGGMIPHDDDADVSIRDIDEENLEKCIEPLKQRGYQLIQIPGGGLWEITKLNPGGKGPHGHLDIFVYEKDPRGDWRLQSWNWRNTFPNTLFEKDEFDTRELKDFDGLQLYAPKDPTKFLFRYYGDDCLDWAYQSHNHLNQIKIGPFTLYCGAILLKHKVPVDNKGKSAKMLHEESRLR